MLLTARGKAPGYGIADEGKLRSLAKEYGLDAEGPVEKVARGWPWPCWMSMGP